jgi:pre-mRNA-splicing factor ATP-dependent RNA helicase DHX15/PRP43
MQISKTRKYFCRFSFNSKMVVICKKSSKAPRRGLNPFTGSAYSRNYYKVLAHRMSLPIWQHRDNFIVLLESNQCITLVGETGSGKTTQIPQWCAEYVKSRPNQNRTMMVGCTQPRRVAATSVAARVAEEMDVKVSNFWSH